MSDTISTLEKWLAEEAFNLDDEKEQRAEENRRKRREACGKKFSQIITCAGELKCITHICKDYRMCPSCRHRKYQELTTDITYAQNRLPYGERLKFIYIHENDFEAFRKSIKRVLVEDMITGEVVPGVYKRVPQPEDMLLVIHNCQGLAGQDLYDIGYDEEDVDLDFNTILQNVPRDMGITGKLGKKKKEEDEDKDGNGNGGPPPEKVQIRRPHLYKEGMTKREASLAFSVAVGKTKGISVETPKDLERAMERRLMAMRNEIGSGSIYFDFIAIPVDSIALWNENPMNGVVRVSTIEKSHSSDTDKKLSSVEIFEKFLAEEAFA